MNKKKRTVEGRVISSCAFCYSLKISPNNCFSYGRNHILSFSKFLKASQNKNIRLTLEEIAEVKK